MNFFLVKQLTKVKKTGTVTFSKVGTGTGTITFPKLEPEP
jgi:hypothetical protein